MKIYTETKRFILREMLPEDAAGMFDLDADPEVHRYLGNKPIKDLEKAKEMISYVRQQYIDNGIGRWAVVNKETNEFMGWAGLKLVKEMTNNHVNFYDLGYRLIRKYWGRGIATECALASLTYGFEVMKLNEIYAATHVNNDGSNKIIRNMGFTFIETFFYDGEKQNWYKMNAGEWAKRGNKK